MSCALQPSFAQSVANVSAQQNILSGRWLSEVIETDVEAPLLTEFGEALLNSQLLALTAEDKNCEPPVLPAIAVSATTVQFSLNADTVVISYPEWNVERIVYLQPGMAPAVQDALPYGVSFGRWEKPNTLAIFTTYIAAPQIDTATPLTSTATVLERYTPAELESGGHELRWHVTITDEQTLTAPSNLRGILTAAPEAASRGDLSESADATQASGLSPSC